MQDGISYRDYLAQILSGNPYGYRIDDVARYYMGGLGERMQDWFRNRQMQQMLDNANRQLMEQQTFKRPQGLGY